jgi:putative protease
LENNRQNLERTLGSKNKGSGEKRSGKQGRSALHSRFFITVFAWPPLFNTRANLDSVLDFNAFADNKNETFTLVTGYEGSMVYPKKHFSIVDKIPFLKEAGFRRFIIDLTGPVLKKSDYKDLMKPINENAGLIQPLPHSSRFNWKDGFYTN